MKNLIITSLFALISAASSSALAHQPQSGGFDGGQGATQNYQMMTTVRQVLDSGSYSDDMPVTLTGSIIASLGGEMYTFADSTGQITVEIDHDEWYGLKITPEKIVVINGEIDKEYRGTMIDVKRILAK